MNKVLLPAAAVMIAVLLFSCGKDEEPVVISKTLSITAITPAEGTGGTHVIIKGTNFNPNAAGNLVLFHTDTAVVSAAFPDSLEVVAPLHGSTGPVSVTVAGETAIGPLFTYLADTTSADTTHAAEDSVDIYAAGYDSRPTYWINGTEYVLTHQGTASYSSAYALALADTDLYIAGTDDTKAKYWKNGVETILSNPDFQGGEARTLAVSGSDIYIGGADHYLPVYWKNGVEISLSASSGGIVNSIALYNGDVYAAGRLDDTAVMWKNGVYTKLSTLITPDVEATGIAFSGSDVYVCGVEDGNAILWKNGIKTVLASPLPNRVGCRANAIAAIGNNILVAGSDDGSAAYWLNGTEEKLPQVSKLSSANAIALYKDDVYIAGSDNTSVPVYWKNGIEYPFPSGISSTAYAIAVVQPH